tara:strand:- start:1319 stop:1879 length:561 start_codon:yes stop_codon:yes gene_type:complete
MTDTVRVPREPTPEMVRAGCAVTCVECFADCKSSDAAAIYRAMLAASPQEAVPTKREAALADLAKLDGETMDLEHEPQGEGDWITHDGGPNPVPDEGVEIAAFEAYRVGEDSSPHPTSIKPSADTGELRERVAASIGLAWAHGTHGKPFDVKAETDAILDLIQSERSSPIGQNDQPGLAFSDAGEP